MASIFTKIILGEIPCYKVAENDNYFAFLDIRPLVKGHTLVIPKKEIDYIFDMEDRALAEMFSFTKRVAMVLKEEVECTRIGISVIGLEVPHAHVHLIPCLLYTSDAADERSSVDLGGRRIIQKKNIVDICVRYNV
mgnify:CR=1 FL=1